MGREKAGVFPETYSIESQDRSLNFIGGEWVPADSGETSEIVNPSNPSEVLGTTPDRTRRRRSGRSKPRPRALPDWKDTLPAARGAVLMEAANIIESREDELARLMALEAGKPMKEARMEVGRAASIFRYYGSEGWRMTGMAPPSARPGVSHSSIREPLGVVGLITPWNFPLAIPTWKMAPALICGNTIVIKPASNASP